MSEEAKLMDLEAEVIVDNLKEKFDEYQKWIYIAVGAVVVIVGGIYGYKKFYQEPREAEAKQMLWKAEYYLENGMYDQAINGDGMSAGFADVMNQYGGTTSGNIAAYDLGVSYLQKGEFENAISALQNVDFSDEFLGAIAQGAIGDAYLELGNASKAQSYYKAAIDHSNNNVTSPLYLSKLAIVYKELGDNANALECYTTIKNEFPNSTQANGVEFHIANLTK